MKRRSKPTTAPSSSLHTAPLSSRLIWNFAITLLEENDDEIRIRSRLTIRIPPAFEAEKRLRSLI